MIKVELVAPSINVVSVASARPVAVTALPPAAVKAEAVARGIPGRPGDPGPPGPPGPPGAGAGTIPQVAPAATWIIPHALGRIPGVLVYLASGEQVDADVHASASSVTVSFATAQSGFLILI